MFQSLIECPLAFGIRVRGRIPAIQPGHQYQYPMQLNGSPNYQLPHVPHQVPDQAPDSAMSYQNPVASPQGNYFNPTNTSNGGSGPVFQPVAGNASEGEASSHGFIPSTPQSSNTAGNGTVQSGR
jgi:hypothetical protein